MKRIYDYTEFENVSYKRVAIELGYKCTLQCPYCYVRPQINNPKYENPDIEKKIRDIGLFLKTISENEDREIGLAGGEPTLYDKYFVQLLDIVKNIEGIKAIILFTNGLQISDLLLNKLIELRESGKAILINLSAHVTSETFFKNMEKYIEYFSPYNIKIVKVIKNGEENKVFEIFKTLYERYVNISTKYLTEDGKKFFMENLTDNLFKYILIQPDIHQTSPEYFKEIFRNKTKILKEFALEKYKDEKENIYPTSNSGTDESDICFNFKNPNVYIKIASDLSITPCGYMTKKEMDTPYFYHYTIYDIIEHPDLLNKSFYTPYGYRIIKKYADITYKMGKENGYNLPNFVFCPKRSLVFNKGKIGPYPLEYIEALSSVFDSSLFE